MADTEPIVGEALMIEMRTKKRMNGRVIDRRSPTTWYRIADGRIVAVDDSKVLQVRRTEGIFESGDPVVHAVQPGWRGGVVRTEGDEVLVETKSGFEWVLESDLRDPVPYAPKKRGPIASSPEVELINSGGQL